MSKARETSYSDHTSHRYYQWRGKVGGMFCVLCGKSYRYIEGLELVAHHIYPMAEYPKLRYDSNNGITLCQDCHKKVHAQMKAHIITPNDVLLIKVNYEKKNAKFFADLMKRATI